MLNVAELPWPVVFRRSTRCRYLRINLVEGQAVEVVYPSRSSKKEALQFLQSKLEWVARHQGSLPSSHNRSPLLMPSSICFPAIEQTWLVSTEAALGRKHYSIKQDDLQGHVVFSGPSDNFKELLNPLRRWLKQQAALELQPLFVALSRQYQLPFESVSWRFQKTRWGSCSDKKRISLNVKLLFLSFTEVRYIMLHELCHTKVMSHDRKFWNLLERYCSQAKQMDRELYKMSFSQQKWITAL